jgi:hypothetical protein
MKPLLVATIIAIAAGVASTQSTVVLGFIAEIYPSDLAKREALYLCALANPNFNRLDPAARDTCYQHAFATPAAQGNQVLTASAPNEVDLRQAAGRTGAPRNDVRIVQQSNGATR